MKPRKLSPHQRAFLRRAARGGNPIPEAKTRAGLASVASWWRTERALQALKLVQWGAGDMVEVTTAGWSRLKAEDDPRIESREVYLARIADLEGALNRIKRALEGVL